MKFSRYSLGSQSQTVNVPILITTAFLVIFGLVMIYDASGIQSLRDYGSSYHYVKQQLLWIALGLSTATFFVFFDYHKLKKVGPHMLLGSIVLLLAVFIPGLGVSGGGAHRWLDFRFFNLQPAEIIKLTAIIYLATIFEKKVRFAPFIAMLFIVTLITAVFQRDLGSSLVFVGIAVIMYYSAGAPLWHFFTAAPLGLLAFFLLVLTSEYRTKRILAFLDPFSDTQGFTYHISQILIALGSGGIFGLGLGHSRQKFEYIPEVATDSIFAIIGEELGFIGSIALLFMFAILIVKGLKVAEKAPDNFGRLLATGIISWLSVQVIVNLSSMSALLPLTGVPLPFISYGGSALVVNLTAIGILLNISKQSNQT